MVITKTRLKQCLWLVLLLLLQQAGNAQAPKEKALLWQVSGKGIAQPSYLFGSFHLLCAEDMNLSDAFKQKFSAARTLYLEIDLNEMQQQAALLQMMALPEGITISSLMGKPTYDSVSALFTKYTSMPFALLNQVKPMLLTALLFPAMMSCQPESYEQTLAEMAKKQSIPVKGLETMAFQASMFDSIPYATQASDLAKAVYGFDSLKQETLRMVNLYKQQDLPALYRKVLEDTSFNRFEEMMLFKRNAAWAPVLAKAFQAQPCFVAVGAAHLAGEKGLIALLRKQGFTLTPVSY